MATWYVRKEAPDGGDGTSPETAFNNIREATFAVSRGDRVYIGPGIYQDDPLLIRKAGRHDAYILWIGDDMGQVTGDPAGPVKVPYFDCGYFDSRYNGVWFIDFYDVVPKWQDGNGVWHGGGMSCRLEMNEGGNWGDPYAPKGAKNRFCGAYFVSCKFASSIWILNRWDDKPSNSNTRPPAVFFRQIFISCLIGYGFPAGWKNQSTIFYRSYAPYPEGGVIQKNSGLACFYGCTIKAAEDLLGGYLIHCYNGRADALPSPPWPSPTPRYALSLNLVNCICDLTSSQYTNNKVFRYVGRQNTASFDCKLSGAFNIFRVPDGSGHFSEGFADLSSWQDDGIMEVGDVQVYVDPADDKIKFSLTTEEEFTPDVGYTGGGTVEVEHSTPLVKDQWYHCAISWDRSTGEMKLNIDGNVTSDTLNGMLKTNLVLGSWGGSFYMDRGLRGLMDEIRVWNGALSNADIATYKDQDINPDNFPELYRYYKCDEGSGESAIDTPNTSNKAAPLPPAPQNAVLDGVTYSTDIPFGTSGYSLQFGEDAYTLMGTLFPVDQPEGDNPDPTSSFTVEFWFKLDNLASEIGQNMILMTKGAERVDAASIYKAETDDMFEADGWHLKEESSPIDSGMPYDEEGLNNNYSGNFDVEGDNRPVGIRVDVGADEYTEFASPDHLNPYGFTSKAYGFIREGHYPPKCWVDFGYNQDVTPEGTELCGNTAPAGGWKDELRILISFRPMEEERWIEVLNTETGVDRSGEVMLIPHALRGPHFQVKFEVFPHAEHLKKFDIGMGEEGYTETINQNMSKYKYPSGCLLDVYNMMFKQLVNRVVVKSDGTWSVKAWPGTYYIIPHGQTDKMDQGREFITVGFSDWFAPFGNTNCAIPYQVDWAQFENEFMGTMWASWYAQEQFIDESKRISTEFPNSWPYETYNKKLLVRCGRLLKGASYIEGFRAYAGPSLNIEGYDLMEDIEEWPNFPHFGEDQDYPDIWDETDEWMVT